MGCIFLMKSSCLGQDADFSVLNKPRKENGSYLNPESPCQQEVQDKTE